MTSDLDGLHGIIPTSLRWAAEAGVLGISTYDPAEGERGVEVIELNSPKSKIALDLSTRERGYGMIRKGVFKMVLTPVGTPPPNWPGEEYDPAVGIWGWNPLLGEVRIEACSALFRKTIAGICDQAKVCKEAANGMVPVVQFTDRHRQEYAQGSYWAPIVVLRGWLPRAQIPCFAAREPTVKETAPPHITMIEAPPSQPSALSAKLQEHLTTPPKIRLSRPTDQPVEKPGKNDLDDEIPW
jgi:hypothetical protein